MEGNTALGASSPAKPAFTSPEPLSHTKAVVSSSSHILARLLCNLWAKDRRGAHTQCLQSWPPSEEKVTGTVGLLEYSEWGGNSSLSYAQDINKQKWLVEARRLSVWLRES